MRLSELEVTDRERCALKSFIKVVGDKFVSTINKADFSAWQKLMPENSTTTSRYAFYLKKIIPGLGRVKIRSKQSGFRVRGTDISTYKKILSALEGTKQARIRPWVIMLANTGMRRNELACMKLSWVLFDDKKIAIPAAVTKTKGYRRVPLSKAAIEVINAVFQGNTKITFEEASGIKQASVSCDYLRILRRIGIEASIHDLRHFYATQLLNSGMSIYDIMVLLGHSNIATTARYLAVSDEMFGKANDFIDNFAKI